MGSFRDFLSSGDSKETGLGHRTEELRLATSASIARVLISFLPVPGLSLSTDQASEFSDKAGKLVSSDEFIQELSNRINEPEAGESEEDFVKRAKDALRALLTEKLTK